MTDNRTTELLPCPFCGGEAEVIEADYGMYMTGYAVYCRKCCLKLGVTGRLGETYEWSPVFNTEAEAITAWNTRADYHGYEQAAIEAWKSIKTWNTRATHDTLTAEQVEKAISDCCTYASYDGCTYYASGIRLQAIADELNAELGSGNADTDDALALLDEIREADRISYDDYSQLFDAISELGSGTCKITATATNNLMYPDYMTKWYELSCGHSLTLKGDEAPKWCAVCGKKVER